MQNNLLLNPEEFEIYERDEDSEKGTIYCKRLIEKWTPQLETEMLEAFIRLYYDEMYGNWGPDDEEESKEYWPEISSPTDLIKTQAQMLHFMPWKTQYMPEANQKIRRMSRKMSLYV